jgi:hypothetical protein
MRSVALNQIQRLRFLNPALENELRRALEVVAGGHDSQKKSVRLGFRGEAKREVKVGYVTENPIWKTSYRIVMDKDGKSRLLGWANVENTSDEDWRDIKLTLVSARPISFQMNLYPPLFIPRPTVEPQLFASLCPPTYAGPLTNTIFNGNAGGFLRPKRVPRVRKASPWVTARRDDALPRLKQKTNESFLSFLLFSALVGRLLVGIAAEFLLFLSLLQNTVPLFFPLELLAAEPTKLFGLPGRKAIGRRAV